MNLRQTVFLISLAASAALASGDVFAQRGGSGGGGRGGGMGGGVGSGMGGGHGAGMPSGMQQGGRPGGADAMPGDRGRGQAGPGESRSAEGQRRSTTELLQQNTRLADNLSKLLPAGTDLPKAADGFRNLGQFVAAVHVSSNLGIPFDDLKARMLKGDSLGDAIRHLRPEADHLVETRRANSQAENDLGGG